MARCWASTKRCQNQGFYWEILINTNSKSGLSKEPFQRALLIHIYSEVVIAIIALQLKQGEQVERKNW